MPRHPPPLLFRKNLRNFIGRVPGLISGRAMPMKNYAILLAATLLCGFGVRAQDKSCFFSGEDVRRIRMSAAAPWGAAILDGLRRAVDERRAHALDVPLLEGGHLHHYFCPVHNLRLAFDWDSPRAHRCDACGKSWKGKNYDWAWVNVVHGENLRYLTACTYLYLATGDTLYAGYIRDMMLDYADKYPTYFEHDTGRKPGGVSAGRMFGQSLDESVWASDACRAYLTAKETMAPAEARRIEEGYLKPCARMLLARRLGGNWQVWHNSGLAALGVALDCDSIVSTALDDPQCGYRALMRTCVYDDGWWNEGSPTYHFYPLRAMLLTADAVRCRGIDLFDDKLRNMLAGPVLGAYADLTFPAHNDGWYGESLTAQAGLYEIAAQRFRDPLFAGVLARCYARIPRTASEALLNPVAPAADSVPEPLPGFCFGGAGVGVLRSGERTVVLKYGPHGGGHGHPDKLSVSIHDGKREVLPDLGTSAYGVPDYQGWYRRTVAHNTVTVDGGDQKPGAGRLVAFEATARGGRIEAAADDAYPGVRMTRSLTLDGSRLADRFVCRSDSAHTYDYVLLLTGKPELPGHAEKASPGSSGGYERIRDAEKRVCRRETVCRSGGCTIRISVPGGRAFEVFTGTAPGIPPTNPTQPGAKQAATASRPVQPCYPLIVRVRGTEADIRAEWDIE